MSPELKAFLAAEDLDDADEARKKLKSLSDADAAAVGSVLRQWQDVQAVSNLLFHPDLIPEDVRLATLFRGLGERQENYYVLAALCGVTEIDAARWSAEDRKRVVAELLAILRGTNDIRAQRASVTVAQFAGERDAPQVIALLEHPDKTVRQNLRVWLFRTMKDRGVEALAAAARDSGLGAEAERQVVADFKDYVTNPEGAAYTGPLFAYIPNLREVQPSTWKRAELAPPRQPKAEDVGARAPGDAMERLKDPAPAVRRQAVVALGKQKRESAVPALAQALRDKDEGVRGAAREALVRIGPKSFGALVDVLSCPEEASRTAALNALRRLAPAARKTLTKEQLTTLAAALKDKSISVRVDTAKLLGELGTEAKAALAALFDAAGDSSGTFANENVAEAAITAALRIAPECRPALVRAALPELIAALKGDQAFAAAYAIAKLGPVARDAVPALAETLQADRGYSDNVVLALRDIGGEAIKPLGALLKNPRMPLEKRDDVLWKLGGAETADEQLVSLLADVLKDPEPRLRARAVQALGRLGFTARAATPALLGVLGDAELDTALEHRNDLLAATLARMKTAAVPGLTAAVRDEQRPFLARFQALRALGRMGRTANAARPVLAAAMKDSNRALAVTAAGAYAQAGGDVAKALPVLRDGLRDDVPLVIKAAAFEVERLGPRASALVPDLQPLLKHRERDVRLLAARAVSVMGADARPAVPALAELLKAGDGRHGYEDEIAEALERLGPDAEAALPALIEQLPHLAEVSPHPVLDAIGKMGPRARPALPALLKLLANDESCHHEDVINVLGEIGPEAVPALVARLGDRSEYRRADAARALGRIGPAAREAVPALRKRLDNEWNMVRVWAAFALIRITGDPKPYMPVLFEMWTEGAGWSAHAYEWRLDVSKAFVLLGAEARPTRDLLLEALFDEHVQAGPQQRVAQALGQLRDDADVIVPRLIALTERPADAPTRRYDRRLALEALGLLGPKAKAALPTLRALAEDDDNEVAEAAARALEAVQGR
jgi:HEAT repeat protein